MIEPVPPIPEDTDLRHMPGYMIDVQSLLGSDLAALGDPAANWFAVLTWCASFHQIPAGSLPDDDTVLAYLVRLGRDVRTWKKMREKGAMKGWVKHSDGRLYHPAVTKHVLNMLKKSDAGRIAAAVKQGRPAPERRSYTFDAEAFMLLEQVDPVIPIPSTMVYVAACSDGSSKIGISTDAESRMLHLQNGNAHKIKLFASTGLLARSVAFEVERDALAALSESRAQGEWLRCSAQETVEVANEILAARGLPLLQPHIEVACE